MATRRPITLQPGTVHRTAALRQWDSNPTRLAMRLEARGELQRLSHGLVYVPRRTRFGTAPPIDEELLEAFLGGTSYVITGPLWWNALGLGTTAMHVRPLVYNTKRTGVFRVGRREFELRRVAFPANPGPEWFVVDLLRNASAAGVDRADLLENLAMLVEQGRFDRTRLLEMAVRFGRREEADQIRSVLASRPAV